MLYWIRSSIRDGVSVMAVGLCSGSIPFFDMTVPSYSSRNVILQI